MNKKNKLYQSLLHFLQKRILRFVPALILSMVLVHVPQMPLAATKACSTVLENFYDKGLRPKTPQQAIDRLGRWAEINSNHLAPIFQDENSQIRDLPEYVNSLYNAQGRLLPLEQFKEVLKTIDDKIYQLTDKIVQPQNIELYMLRHKSPEDLKSGGAKNFLSSYEQKGMTSPSIPEAINILYGQPLSEGWVDPSLGPKHTFLWFKKLPGRMKQEIMYRRNFGGSKGNLLFQRFGDHLYKIKMDDIKDRALYTIGDFLFTLERNERSMLASEPDESLNKFSGTFPLSDLRGLFLYVFSSLKAESDYLGKKTPGLLSMPVGEVIEVTIWGKLAFENTEYLENKSIEDLPNAPK
jgi:hypothetical protein